MDLARPVKSLGGGHYILNILDIFTRYSWTMVLKSKDKVAEKFMLWKPMVEMQSGTQVHVMRTYGGGELISHALKAWLSDKGVTIQTTPPNSAESNGNSERLNRTLQDKCRTMMVAAGVPGYLWGEFMEATNTLRNLTPVSNLPCTPYEKWTGQKPDLSKLRVLGSKSFCQINKLDRGGKFQPWPTKESLSTTTRAAMLIVSGILVGTQCTMWQF